MRVGRPVGPLESPHPAFDPDMSRLCGQDLQAGPSPAEVRWHLSFCPRILIALSSLTHSELTRAELAHSELTRSEPLALNPLSLIMSSFYRSDASQSSRSSKVMTRSDSSALGRPTKAKQSTHFSAVTGNRAYDNTLQINGNVAEKVSSYNMLVSPMLYRRITLTPCQ